jgi:1,2-diacylglycerol 3-alpha-glucosyltransferase
MPIGIDFDTWKSNSEKGRVRRKLGVRDDCFVLLSSCRLNGLKQIDRMIGVLERIDFCDFCFQYVVTGHGDAEYERYLSLRGDRLIRQGKLKFVGFVPEDKLVDYYEAADLFVSVSLSEGGPISTVKALAMDLPVFTTATGSAAELLLSHKAGVVVPTQAYDLWQHELTKILQGRNVQTLDRNIVKSIYHWSTVIERYLKIYRQLFMKYYCEEGE